MTKTTKGKLEWNLLMRCSHCGICCENTEMMLSNADVERLEKVGYTRQKFMRYDNHGFMRLRNFHGFCVFYDVVKCRCLIYEYRPLGCRIYPVIYSEQQGIVVDGLCPMKNTHRLGNGTQKKREKGSRTSAKNGPRSNFSEHPRLASLLSRVLNGRVFS
jgi:Fe-S-cluster containining protein